MCECGCVYSDEHYRFPGPGESFYLLTIHGGCKECDSPTGVEIEHVLPGTFNHEYYGDPEHFNGNLKFEDWADKRLGVAIACGMLSSEFVAATRNHLIGIDSKDFAADRKRTIDDDGADAILEEMFDDAIKRPAIVKPVAIQVGDS